MATHITPAQFDSDYDLPDWRFIIWPIEARFTAPSFSAAGDLVAAIAAAADEADHHPDVDLRYPGVVHVALVTHSEEALTERDIAMARTISSLAAAAGCTSDPLDARVVEMSIDAMDIGAVRPFWAAVLDYIVLDDDTLGDPKRIGPQIHFQQMDEPRPQRNRIHFEVFVPHDVAEARVAAAVEAGGRVVTDEYARSWWVVADAEGNEACIATWQDRG